MTDRPETFTPAGQAIDEKISEIEQAVTTMAKRHFDQRSTAAPEGFTPPPAPEPESEPIPDAEPESVADTPPDAFQD